MVKLVEGFSRLFAFPPHTKYMHKDHIDFASFCGTIDFIYSVYADVFHIESKPILPVVDGAMQFKVARWLLIPSSDLHL